MNPLHHQGRAPQPPPGLARFGTKPWVVCAVLATATFAVFGPVVGYDYTNYDDPGYVSANPHVLTGLTRENVAWAFRTGHMGLWQPVTWLSFMLDMELFGKGAGGPHATNLLLHIANSTLLFLLLRRMTGRHWCSAGVAALFALHPLRVESVAWVCERKDVLSTFFGLLALWAYTLYAEKSKAQSLKSDTQGSKFKVQRSRFEGPTPHSPSSLLPPPSSFYYLLSLIFLALGLMSKPMLVTLPCVMLLLDYWPLKRVRNAECGARSDGQPGPPPGAARLGSLLLEKLPFFLLAGICSVITVLGQRTVGAMVSLARLPISTRVENALVSYARYLGKTIWPVGLANPYPNPWEWPLGYVLLAALLVGGLCAAAVWWARRHPFVFTGWFWFFGTLVPVIGLVQAGEQPLADRFTYFPLIGLFMAAAWGWGELAARWSLPRRYRALAWGVPAIVLLACALRTADQRRHWRNGETMFRHAIEVTKGNYIAYNNLGGLLEGQGKLDEAIGYYVEALRFKPDFAQAHNNLGQALTVKDRLNEAERHLRQSLQLDPKWAGAHNNLGNLLLRQGKREAAMAAYRQALALDADLPEAHNSLGCLLAAQGKLEEAAAHFQQAVRSRPNFTDALNNLGTMLTELGRAAEAVAPLTRAIQLKPDYADAHYNLANALAALQQPREAMAEYQTVLRLKPNHALAHYRMGSLLLAEGEAAAAIQHYREALRLKPDWVEPLKKLAWLLATHLEARYRDGAEAVRLATRGAELTQQHDAEDLDTLAAAYAEAGRFQEAVTTAERATALAEASGQKGLADETRKRRAEYQAGRAYRQGGGT